MHYSNAVTTNLSRNLSNIRPRKEFFISIIYGCNKKQQQPLDVKHRYVPHLQEGMCGTQTQS